ncbi:MAG TPA: hypothetical protein PKH95_02075 [Candidatus Magasanikbacteria bacterium]|nr:hypothetical protein [Candidatus Magasanikbacteria bacterium]
MIKNILGGIKIYFLISLFTVFLLLPSLVFAEDATDKKAIQYGAQKVYHNSLLSTIGIANKEPLAIAQSIVTIVLGFVGIVLFTLILYAGFIWIKAKDNSGEVEKAKGIIESALIGVVVISLAYAISEFIFNRLVSGS